MIISDELNEMYGSNKIKIDKMVFKQAAKTVKLIHVGAVTMFEDGRRSKLFLLVFSSFPFRISEIRRKVCSSN